jgi:hypothetical protein
MDYDHGIQLMVCGPSHAKTALHTPAENAGLRNVVEECKPGKELIYEIVLTRKDLDILSGKSLLIEAFVRPADAKNPILIRSAPISLQE